MEKQRWEASEKGREEERRSEKRKSQKKEDAGARKGRKVAKHCVFPQQRKLMGSSAQNSSGVHWCGCRVGESAGGFGAEPGWA